VEVSADDFIKRLQMANWHGYKVCDSSTAHRPLSTAVQNKQGYPDACGLRRC
jgi:hypothetical protein